MRIESHTNFFTNQNCRALFPNKDSLKSSRALLLQWSTMIFDKTILVLHLTIIYYSLTRIRTMITIKAHQLSSCGGLEVKHPIHIQLKAGHLYLGGLNPAWGRMMERF